MHSVERTVTRWRWSFYSVDLPVTYGHCALFTGVILRAGVGALDTFWEPAAAGADGRGFLECSGPGRGGFVAVLGSWR